MMQRFLLTSFKTWLPEQVSNSSDDLLIEVSKVNYISGDLTFVRQLPVDVELASNRVLQKIESVQPDVIVCCGMAATRPYLSIESCASGAETVLYTKVDLKKLLLDIGTVEVSHDCGKFVCEGLYYSVLDYLQQKQLPTVCIFVHVPILTSANLPTVVADFLLIIDKLALL
ncbi:MAG: peptidase C15 [Nostocaceae cyanobacterium]|nr:peptidase C15 [Nostocaceae cyanobacterium]